MALDRSKVLEEEPIEEGDCVTWFTLPDGRLLLSKDPEGTLIERVSAAYYHLSTEIIVEER